MADVLVLEEEDIANSDTDFQRPALGACFDENDDSNYDGGSEQRRLEVSLCDGSRWTFVSDRDRDIQDMNPNDTLTAVERLEKYIAEHKATNKRAVAQAVVDTLRVVSPESPQDVTSVLQILSRLAEDSDSQLRTDMMVQVPQIAYLCYEVAGQLAGVVEGHLLPLVIKTLTDIEESVRKTAQTALILLMEQNLVTCEAIEDQVCPVVLMLADMGTLTDYHSNAVMLMSKIAPLIGREKAMQLFLDHFVTLCSDQAIFVRTVCAANIGDFCTLMGTEVTEHVLLPCFVQLCKDGIWGVRKECANVFLSVSCVVTLETRKNVLAPIFVELLRDQSRWVKVAAYHSLGPFIWTFAPDSIRSQEPNSPSNYPDTPRSSRSSKKTSRSSEKKEDSSPETSDERGVSGNASGVESVSGGDSSTVEAVDPENDFNTFLYWRWPIPEVGPDASLGSSPESGKALSTPTPLMAVASVSAESSVVSSTGAEDPSSVDRDKMDISWSPSTQKNSSPNSRMELKSSESNFEEKDDDKPSVSLQSEKSDELKEENGRIDEEAFGSFVSLFDSVHRTDSDGLRQEKRAPGQVPLTQDIVPQALIDHYISMSTPLQFNEEDPELAHHCAFNFPAVALTLGRENWPILNGAYEVLAVDVQWKVRRTLASSIHELAVILGEELATRYLAPVFNGLAKDLDEVRIGVLKHLADFLKLIGPAGRNKCLHCLTDLLMNDNHLNWRFRDELTKQLIQVTSLFSLMDVRRFLSHMGMVLLYSKVAAVRSNAMILLADHIRYLSADKKLVESLLVELAKEFARSEHWMRRQSYALLCEQLLVPRSQTRVSGEGDEDDDEEGVDRGQYWKRDSMQDEWVDDKQEEMSWRTNIAALLAQHVYPYLLDLSCDKVPNVRLAVARVLASFQAMPAEQSYLNYYLDKAGESDSSDTKPVPLPKNILQLVQGQNKYSAALDIALAQLQKDTDQDVRHFASQNQLWCHSSPKTPNKSVEENDVDACPSGLNTPNQSVEENDAINACESVSETTTQSTEENDGNGLISPL
ncbi:serine/threonine-protein phosphatase 4 regulatory subunit 1-like isoform X2 [Ischnura elegans]|uniref:serine/threonine-protein phosphatase 4 regulatory subunit 1-like isoform X2 n=1 Tax=Ischnura elegans TaxID=197161 RepID=UPI001ED8AE47|nr:serine/threonine-protein phosphatase 4 regulatory subunit 1-like isoform X2 [Ischnura elegans]